MYRLKKILKKLQKGLTEGSKIVTDFGTGSFFIGGAGERFWRGRGWGMVFLPAVGTTGRDCL